MSKRAAKNSAVPVGAFPEARHNLRFLQRQLREGQPISAPAREYLCGLVEAELRAGDATLQQWNAQDRTANRDWYLALADAIAERGGVSGRRKKIAKAFRIESRVTWVTIKNASGRVGDHGLTLGTHAQDRLARIESVEGRSGLQDMSAQIASHLSDFGADEDSLLAVIRPD